MCMQFPENQKRALGTLELELKIGDATTWGTGIELLLLTAEPHLQSPCIGLLENIVSLIYAGLLYTAIFHLIKF